MRKHYQKRSIFAKQVDDIWTADLADMSPYSRSNSGYKYLLTVIDVFSKYGRIVPLKTKTGKEVAMEFQQLFTNNAPLVDGQECGILQPECKDSPDS